MCGIVGAVGELNIVPILLEGLKRLEYRGYDSAGLAVITDRKHIERVRCLGKVVELANKVRANPIQAHIGIAHTRWATHGKPSEANAHPHVSGDFAIVHNGIIENYAELKTELLGEGVKFESETDTEVVAHLLARAMKTHADPKAALDAILPELKGAYALLVMHRHFSDRLFVVRKGSPLVIGLGIEENFVGSDSLSLLPVTRQFIYLEEHDVAEVSRFEVKIFNHGKIVKRAVEELQANDDAALKGQYKHYMQKEIDEQPRVVSDILSQCLNEKGVVIESFGVKAAKILPQVKQIKIIACGTSYHAGLVAKYWFESIAKISCDVEIASEYRYRETVTPQNCLFISISQSGETADTLAALRLSKTQGYIASLAICNVPTSTLVRESDLVFLMRAGVEVGVASTKAFTAQVLGLFLLVKVLADLNGLSSLPNSTLKRLAKYMNDVLLTDTKVEALAEFFKHNEHALFLGRGLYYPIAMEAALKLKEISYIHAEAYAAGELKHGPLALVDENMPVVVIVPPDSLQQKVLANIEEVMARGGEVFVIGTANSLPKHKSHLHRIEIPLANDLALFPFIVTLPLQLLAYHVALLKGTDVDQPRNLAKSVTVE